MMKTFQEYMKEVTNLYEIKVNEFKMSQNKGDIRQDIKNTIKELTYSPGIIEWIKNKLANVLIDIMSEEELQQFKNQLEHFAVRDLSRK